QSHDLRKRARQFLRGSIQSRALAQPFDGGNREALRDIQTHEPIRGSGVMTTDEDEYRRLLRRTLSITAFCIATVFICYFWIDRPVAFFVYRHHINTIQFFRWLTYPPPEVQNWSALVVTILVVRRAWGPFLRWQKVLLVACISLIVADDFRISLCDVFGRYWPETWTHDNPSLIGTGTYGFHPFQRGD